MAIQFEDKSSSPFLYNRKDWTTGASPQEPGVSVILRTRDRPVFLERAIKSIAGQTFKDVTLCIINDGGDAHTVEQITRAHLPENIGVDFLHLSSSVGQVAALNLGFEQVRRRYFAIYDDDDTWSPDFLVEMVSFLQGPSGAPFIGAVCHAQIVEESLGENGIVIHNRRAAYRHDQVLSLFKSLDTFSFPVGNSFLMRYESLAIASQNNSAMPVMYDFEWIIRVLLKADIAVVPKELAFYHQRNMDHEKLGATRNSIFAAADEFRRLSILLQNEQLRSEIAEGRLGVGFIGSLVQYLREQAQHHDMVEQYLSRQANRYYRRRTFFRKLKSLFKLGHSRRNTKS